MEEEKEKQENKVEDSLESEEVDKNDQPEGISLEDKVRDLEDKLLRLSLIHISEPTRR